jgi:hypothetical protein
MFHFHFGAGALGLGLVLPVLAECSSSTYVLARKSESDSKSGRRNLSLSNLKSFVTIIVDEDKQNQSPTKVCFDEFFEYIDDETCSTDFGQVLDHAIANGLEQTRLVFVTSAVKDFDAARLISVFLKMLRNRVIDETLICFCAMENNFKSSDVKLRYMDHEDVKFIDCIVDRICSNVGVEENVVFVEAESYGKIFLDLLSMPESLTGVLKKSKDLIATPRLEVQRAFKLGVINAAHILVAGEAQTYHMPMLHYFLTMEDIGSDLEIPTLDDRLNHLKKLLIELSVGVVAIVKNMNDEQSNALIEGLTANENLQNVISRFCFVPDQVGRILARLRKPEKDNMHTMSEFLRNTLDKLLPPVHAYVVERQSGPPSVTISFLKIATLIADRRFVDVSVTTQ